MTQAEDETVQDQDDLDAEDAEAEEFEQEEGDEPETEQTTDEEATEADSDEVVVSIGEESPPSDEEETDEPGLVNKLRKVIREKTRRVTELEQKESTATKAEQAVVVGQKPSLEACEYDSARFETELESWHERKRAAEAKDREKQEADRAAQAAWQGRLDAYGKAKAELKVKDFEDAEANALENLSQVQQAIVLNGADAPATVIYALGKNPKKAKELASITDPVKFAFAVAKLETQLKVTPRKSIPLPEKTVRGSAPASAVVDTKLKRLEDEAERSGDRTKVIAYKRQQRPAA
jgi:hypothetical protein